jgi:hypothetical protein
MWCWAAITQSVGRYLTGNTSVTQCDIVAGTYGYCGNWGSQSLNTLKNALVYEYGVISNDNIWSSVSFDRIKSEINANQPVMAYWQWIGASNGHDLTIRGYYHDTYYGIQNVYYLNPASDSSGGAHTASYGWFVNDGTHNWQETLTGIHR